MRGKRGPRDLMKKTVPQLQNTLWPLFAEYIKAVHPPSCFTCDKAIRGADCQAGHWIPRTYSPVKYDEGNVRPQCSYCNKYHAGKPVEFERRLRLEIGYEAVEDLKRRSTESWKWDKLDLIAKIGYYKALLKEMK